ncbi:Ankyrin repeat domain-containing protein 39 [Apophysomyces ossiformis]|uniref:Ankyrin repeat domain-containing protein 39 n=1 Tax=Apophysomyces ossiformis TaxID=679940 RepID=A0A8H7BZA8_9FUNG|nr:Ankyrin repeat domain-containing protein 39 [Apophysomyces ossiformis]
MDATELKNHYSKQALPPLPTDSSLQVLYDAVNDIPCDITKQRLCVLIKEFIAAWSEHYDSLLDGFHMLQQRHRSIRRAYIMQYRKAMKAIKFYQERDETYAGAHACLSDCFSLSGRQIRGLSSSCYSSGSSINNSSVNTSDIHDELLYNGEFDLISLLDCKDIAKATPVLSTSSASISGSSNSGKEGNPIGTKSDSLVYACTDGFWDTIAKATLDKLPTDTLIQYYLQRGGNPNVAKPTPTIRPVLEGYGLVHALVSTNHISGLQKVIDAGANVDVYPLCTKENDRYSPVVLAAKLGHYDCVRLLIDDGGVDIMKSYGPCQKTALHAAVEGDAVVVVLYLLRIQPSLLTCKDTSGATPLHYACQHGRHELLKALAPTPRHADIRDNHGEAPLHYAVRYNQAKVVASIVDELQVDLNPYLPNQVQTPLDLAKSIGLRNITNILKRGGAKTTTQMESEGKRKVKTCERIRQLW